LADFTALPDQMPWQDRADPPPRSTLPAAEECACEHCRSAEYESRTIPDGDRILGNAPHEGAQAFGWR
jgi:hypothetical protein